MKKLAFAPTLPLAIVIGMSSCSSEPEENRMGSMSSDENSGGASNGGDGDGLGGRDEQGSSDGPCASDKDCDRDSVCDQDRRVCVNCLTDADCADDEICKANTCEGVTSCSSSKDCPLDEVCATDRGHCVECEGDNDCEDGSTCLENVCRTSCGSDKDCRDSDQLCEKDLGVCADCTQDADCAESEHCTNLTCRPDVCEEGESVCDGNAIASCLDSGAGFGNPSACAPGQVCEEGRDGASCMIDENPGSGGNGSGGSGSGGEGSGGEGSGGAGSGGQNGTGGDGGGCVRAANGECTVTLGVTYRDFDASHSDFQAGCSGVGPTLNLVNGTLTNGKPVPATDGVASCTTNLAEWYVPSANSTEFVSTMVLYEEEGTGTYANRWGANGEKWETMAGGGNIGGLFNGTPFFFPVDGIPNARGDNASIAQISTTEYGMSGAVFSELALTGNGPLHNFGFTSEITFVFDFEAATSGVIRVVGDDDIWVFVNGSLAIDLGGVHSTLAGAVNIEGGAPTFGMSTGNSYEVKIFHAERQTTGSSFRLEVSDLAIAPN